MLNSIQRKSMRTETIIVLLLDGRTFTCEVVFDEMSYTLYYTETSDDVLTKHALCQIENDIIEQLAAEAALKRAA